VKGDEPLTKAEELARFVVQAHYSDLSQEAVKHLKMRVLDSLGCAIGALNGEPVSMIRTQTEDFGPSGRCTLIGGQSSSPDRAAFYNSALVRYLDFNDSYLAKKETCHPSDNLGAILAATEYSDGSGRDLLLALAVAYQVQCRLSDVAPVRARGFDHTTQGSFAVAAGVSKALGLDVEKTTNALGICGTAFNALRVTRTGALSHWKGLAYPNTVLGCTHATFLAMRGITGPNAVFEGNKGFMDAISGNFEIDWSREDLERVLNTIIKKYNAEIHSQSAVEGMLELKGEHSLNAGDVDRIEVDIFDVAFNIIGGGEEGEKKHVRLKEEADHSLPYIIAVAILDGNVMPEQYEKDRINRNDVQQLLKKVTIRPSEKLSGMFPEAMPCRITVHLKNGKKLGREKSGYEGFYKTPMKWDTVVRKFGSLSEPFVMDSLREQIIEAVDNLESIKIKELVRLLGNFGPKES
jgi:2-methylcitrate dehydratase